jgi:hypothetical protein
MRFRTSHIEDTLLRKQREERGAVYLASFL